MIGYSKQQQTGGKKKKKTTNRKVLKDVAEQALERDGYRCVYCGGGVGLELHHCFFGSQANRNDNRNDLDQVVCLCNKHHTSVHSKGGEEIRHYCIDYLENINNYNLIK